MWHSRTEGLSLGRAAWLYIRFDLYFIMESVEHTKYIGKKYEGPAVKVGALPRSSCLSFPLSLSLCISFSLCPTLAVLISVAASSSSSRANNYEILVTWYHCLYSASASAASSFLCLLPTFAWLTGWLDNWMDGQLAEWLNGWMDGWLVGWMC